MTYSVLKIKHAALIVRLQKYSEDYSDFVVFFGTNEF